MRKELISNVFLAEDDEDDRFFFQQAIMEINPDTKVEIVSNGIQLLNLLQHYCPDILFLDLDTPGKNGLECLVDIRSNPKVCHLPIVVFSSTNKPFNIQAAYDMGADLVLIKPHSIKEYNSSMKTILNLNWNDPKAVKAQYFINGRFTAFS